MSSEALLKYKAAKCGELLAKSFLREELKSIILENIDKATEEDLDKLFDSLEREQMELERISKEIGEFEKEENEEWKELQAKQEEKAQEMVDEFLANEMKMKI